ncbi:MAG TPA: CpaF family protein [Euzebyales bacterium]|nr:CpaF family protein [Euzebyales bacterium]
MRLSERLEHRQGTPVVGPAIAVERGRTAPAGTDPLAKLKQRVQSALYARLGTRLYDASLTEERLAAFVKQELASVVAQEEAPLTPDERQALISDVANDVMGYGPIAEFLDDDSVTEIMVNSVHAIYVEREGQLHRTPARFASEDHLRRIIDRIVAQIGRRIDESSPMVDARLPDGSRVNAVIPPLSVDGPALTIRKFSRDPFQVDDLISFGTVTADVAEELRACVIGRRNILVSGGTGTGKTTLLNVLSSYVPDTQRIVTIEDAVELQLHQEHVVRLESRPSNIEGKGEVTIRDLVRNALRMRPDRIIVGEVRSGEALDMLQAMNTGHEGSLSTVHANSPRDAMSRLETMVLMAGMDLPMRAIREQISAALDLVVHLARMRDGSRRVTRITEVQGTQDEVITLQDIFAFDFDAGVDEHGRYLGRLRPTGMRPRFAEDLRHAGIQLGGTLFGGLSELQRGPRR